MTRKYTVLYIDDNADNRILVERFLGFEGFEVHSAGTGEQGLEQATLTTPDVFLIDLNLPDMDGYRVAEILNQRSDTQAVPKILFTATDIDISSRTKGFDYFLQKPFDVSTLARKIEYAIEHPDGAEHTL